MRVIWAPLADTAGDYTPKRNGAFVLIVPRTRRRHGGDDLPLRLRRWRWGPNTSVASLIHWISISNLRHRRRNDMICASVSFMRAFRPPCQRTGAPLGIANGRDAGTCRGGGPCGVAVPGQKIVGPTLPKGGFALREARQGNRRATPRARLKSATRSPNAQ